MALIEEEMSMNFNHLFRSQEETKIGLMVSKTIYGTFIDTYMYLDVNENAFYSS
jgi:hypothetical protein